MKTLKYLPLLAFIFIFAGFVKTPAHAEGSGVRGNVNVGVNLEDDDKEDDSDDDHDGDGSNDDDNAGDKNDDKGDHRGEARGKFGDKFFRGEDNKKWSGIAGKVTAINSNTITVSAMTPWNKDSKTTVYTVDATNAKVDLNGTTGTLSDIKVDDMIIVEGTVTDTNVSATVIHDGMFKPKWAGDDHALVTSGDPVVGGTVTAISGTTITIKNRADVTYTIEAKDAKIVRKGFSTSVLADVKVGDNVLVQGPVNNTSVTAKLIIDSAVKMDDNGNAGHGRDDNGDRGQRRGFFKKVGFFFKGWFTR